MRHGDSTQSGAFFDTSGAKPAFFGIEDNGGLLFLRVGHHDVGWTHFHAKVAAVAYIGVEFLPSIGCHRVGRHIYFVTHVRSPFSIMNLSLSMELIVFFVAGSVRRFQIKVKRQLPDLNFVLLLS